MYIVEADSQQRESEAIRHIAGSFHKHVLLQAFGFDDLAWIIVEALKPKLTPGIVGDVDLLVGNLDFRDWEAYGKALAQVEAEHPEYPHITKTQLAGKMISEANGLRWPPEPVYVVGVEVKCAYFTNRLQASKSSDDKIEGIRKQIDWLERMGLDKVGLLDVIGNEPAYQEDGGFLGALSRADRSLQAMQPILERRLPPESRAAQFVWSVGAVGGGDEGMRGAGQPLGLSVETEIVTPEFSDLIFHADPAWVQENGGGVPTTAGLRFLPHEVEFCDGEQHVVRTLRDIYQEIAREVDRRGEKEARQLHSFDAPTFLRFPAGASTVKLAGLSVDVTIRKELQERLWTAPNVVTFILKNLEDENTQRFVHIPGE